MSKASDARDLRSDLRTESEATLRRYLAPGVPVYSIVRNVSQSGMSRDISFHVIVDGEPLNITHHVGVLTNTRMSPNGYALRVKGCGMDMCFATVYALGRVLYPDGFKLADGQHGRNGDQSGFETDGGYALTSRVL